MFLQTESMTSERRLPWSMRGVNYSKPVEDAIMPFST